MRRIFCITVFIFLMSIAVGQRYADQLPQKKRYSISEIYDSINGISIFDKLILALGGDSIKFNLSGYNQQGWDEEHYKSGKTLHQGFYVDGKLKVFKNFYENGVLERSFVNPDPIHSTMNIYYDNGTQKKKINYYEGRPQKEYHYYENGMPKLTIEKEKELKYITSKKSWFDNGQIEYEFELKDKKDLLFTEKKYFRNGQLMEEGEYILDEQGTGYQKKGIWTFYDDKGKNKRTEKFQ